MIDLSRYMSQAACLTNDDVVIFLTLFSDIGSAAMLFLLGTQLWLRRRRGYLLLPHQCAMVTAVVILYAIIHILSAGSLFVDIYRVEIVVRGAALGIMAVLVTTACWRRR